MKLKIEIEMDNAAFKGELAYIEVNHCLKEIKYRLDLESKQGARIPLRDSNGNTVGFAEIRK